MRKTTSTVSHTLPSKRGVVVDLFQQPHRKLQLMLVIGAGWIGPAGHQQELNLGQGQTGKG